MSDSQSPLFYHFLTVRPWVIYLPRASTSRVITMDGDPLPVCQGGAGPDVVIWPRGMPQPVGMVLLCQSQLSWPQEKVLEQPAPLGPVSEYNLKWFLVTHCGAVSTLLVLPVVSLSLGKGRKRVCCPCKERQGRQSFAHDMLRECQQTGPGLQDGLSPGLPLRPGCVSVSLYLYSLTKSAGLTCSLRGPLEGSSARLDCITSASLPCSECCSLLRSPFSMSVTLAGKGHASRGPRHFRDSESGTRYQKGLVPWSRGYSC